MSSRLSRSPNSIGFPASRRDVITLLDAGLLALIFQDVAPNTTHALHRPHLEPSLHWTVLRCPDNPAGPPQNACNSCVIVLGKRGVSRDKSRTVGKVLSREMGIISNI